MRHILLASLVSFLLFAVGLQADEPKTETVKPTAEQFRNTLSRSTLAVYLGEQKCAWDKEDDEWECSFEEHFVCTATVIGQLEDEKYLALTAGHCFEWSEEGRYYVADNTVGKPVLHKVELLKFESDERYDYGLISFSSARDYIPIPIEGPEAGAPLLGTHILNVNFSYGIVKEYAEGKVVSELVTGDSGGHCRVCKGRYLVGIGLGPGASGSAVVDMDTQEIVGIVEAIFPETQMPTVVMPMGSKFIDFFEDDSAGLKPLPEGPRPKEPKVEVKSKPEPWLSFYKILYWLSFFIPF
jgi:trypsin-like peptidase